MTVREIYDAIDRIAPFQTAMDFDNVGILVGDENVDVTKTLLCLDVTPRVLREAKSIGVELIISHHPVIFNPLRTVRPQNIIYALVQSGIAVISAHTNLDMAYPYGVNDALCRKLGLQNVRGILKEGETDIAYMGELPEEMTTEDFAAHIKEALGLSAVRCTAVSKMLRTVAVVGGAGGDYALAAQAKGADAFAKLLEAADKGAGIDGMNAAFGGGETVEAKPLAAHRAVEHFEALRRASAEFKKKNGFAPKIFLATMGPLVQHKIRADFIRGFFEVGGFDVVYPNGFESGEAAAKAFAESGAKYAVICSTDDTYPTLVPETTRAIKAVAPDATVYMAGVPAPEAEPAYKEAGYDGAVSIKSNNYETLKSILSALGVL